MCSLVACVCQGWVMCESVDNDSARGYYTKLKTGGATPYLCASSRQFVGKPQDPRKCKRTDTLRHSAAEIQACFDETGKNDKGIRLLNRSKCARSAHVYLVYICIYLYIYRHIYIYIYI